MLLSKNFSMSLRYRHICERIKSVYVSCEQVTDELVDKIFDHCLESSGHDKEMLSRMLEKVLPPEFNDAIQMIEEGNPFNFFIPDTNAEQEGGGGIDVSMDDIDPGDVGGKGEDE